MSQFDLMETSVAKVHEAIRAGQLTVKKLLEAYLARIDTYEKRGPALNSIIRINPRALDQAAELDRFFEREGELSGPLHGIPVMLKDNIGTYDMPTTAGSKLFEDFVTGEDAFIVRKLRKAGAIILAKTNLHEFAVWGETVSSLLGQTINPYDLTRTPGGSSGGTGASIAANFGIIGIGSDTINSIRSPASANSLVGIRPTAGLVGRSGLVPYSWTQDAIGPICRTVEDSVRTLDVIVGYDPDDAVTAWSVGRLPLTYRDSLRRDGLVGKRLGVLKSFFGKEAINEPVNQVMETALPVFTAGGAVLLPLDEAIDPDWIVREVSVHLDDLKTHLNGYLSKLGSKAPAHSLEEILESGLYYPGIEENLKTALKLEVGTADYNEKRIRQAELRTRIMKLLADHGLDALVFPHQQQLACKIGGRQKQRNGALCSVTGFPSLTLPAGFAPSPDAPLGVPVGLEIIGRPYSEPLLIEIGYAFEQEAGFRLPPLSTPALPSSF